MKKPKLLRKISLKKNLKAYAKQTKALREDLEVLEPYTRDSTKISTIINNILVKLDESDKRVSQILQAENSNTAKVLGDSLVALWDDIQKNFSEVEQYAIKQSEEYRRIEALLQERGNI